MSHSGCITTLSLSKSFWKPESRLFVMYNLQNSALNQLLQGHLASHHSPHSMHLQHNRRSPIRMWWAKMGKQCKSLQLCTFLLTFCIFGGNLLEHVLQSCLGCWDMHRQNGGCHGCDTVWFYCDVCKVVGGLQHFWEQLQCCSAQVWGKMLSLVWSHVQNGKNWDAMII